MLRLQDLLKGVLGSSSPYAAKLQSFGHASHESCSHRYSASPDKRQMTMDESKTLPSPSLIWSELACRGMHDGWAQLCIGAWM